MIDATAIRELAHLGEKAAAPSVVKRAGRSYYRDPQGNLESFGPQIVHPETLHVGTLSGLTDYLTADPGTEYPAGTIVHVETPASVRVIGPPRMSDTGTRDCFVHASTTPVGYAVATEDREGWLDQSTFMVHLQTRFHPSSDRDELAQVVGLMKVEEGVELSDNGVTQKVATGRGVSLVQMTDVRPVWNLRPMVSFPDLYATEPDDDPPPMTPPEVPFLLRIGKSGEVRLIPADGGAWRFRVVQQVVDYLTLHRPVPFTVIS